MNLEDENKDFSNKMVFVGIIGIIITIIFIIILK